jgi:Fe-S cluster assembly scaffold protein SufB
MDVVLAFKEEVKLAIAQLSYPTSADEAWRKFPLSKMDFPSLSALLSPPQVVTTRELNEKKVANLSKVEEILSSLLRDTKDNYFGLYTLLHAETYFYLSIDSDDKESSEIDWHCKVTENQSCLSVFLLDVASNVSLKLREKYSSISKADKLHYFGSVSYYQIDENANLDILIEENFDENLYHIRFVGSNQGKDSNLSLHSFPIGGFQGKVFYNPILSGKGSNYLLSGVSALVHRELLDLDAKVTHLGDFTNSKIQYKAIVSDRSHHIFTGNLSIPSQVKKVTAHQESQNLSLSKKARAEANPKLEVMAEDVSCTHGATVGDIDEEQLFYLLSRGLNLEESKSLLVSAFYEEAVARIPFPEDVKAQVSEGIRARVIGR